MLAGEQGANKGKLAAVIKAKKIGLDEAHDLFDKFSRDEGLHARTLDGLLKRHF